MEMKVNCSGEHIAPINSRRARYMFETLNQVVYAAAELEDNIELLREQVYCAADVFQVEDAD